MSNLERVKDALCRIHEAQIEYARVVGEEFPFGLRVTWMSRDGQEFGKVLTTLGPDVIVTSSNGAGFTFVKAHRIVETIRTLDDRHD